MNSEENPDQQLTVSAISALHSGNKTEAIKIIRREKCVGLKEAEDIVDEYLKIHPEIQTRINNFQAEIIRNRILWLITIVLIATLAIYYF